MARYKIKNFTEIDALEVQGVDHKFLDEDIYEALVDVVQHAAGMRFQHSMRPDQARFMATALIMAANEAEELARAKNAAIAIKGQK